MMTVERGRTAGEKVRGSARDRRTQVTNALKRIKIHSEQDHQHETEVDDGRR